MQGMEGIIPLGFGTFYGDIMQNGTSPTCLVNIFFEVITMRNRGTERIILSMGCLFKCIPLMSTWWISCESSTNNIATIVWKESAVDYLLPLFSS